MKLQRSTQNCIGFISDSFVHVKDILGKTYEKISDLHDSEAKDKY